MCTKQCIGCKEIKDLEEFHRNSKSKDGRRPYCKVCVNSWYDYSKVSEERRAARKLWVQNDMKENPIKYKVKDWNKKGLNITAEQYLKMYADQGGCCYLCGKSELELTYKLSLDHCHETGQIRGLLCMNCNVGLGNFQDNTEILRKAIEYLDKYKIKI